MLTEKYRPNKLENIVGNSYIIEQFKNYTNETIPHMILIGSPGVGKTTSITCLGKKLLKEEFNNNFLELNASSERGIEIIRNKVKTFCQKSIDNEYIKIIFFDEAESLTIPAQQALRRMIEKYSSKTRFIFACNSISPIIDAIKSRCKIIKYNKINNKDVKNRIIKICKTENINYTKKSIDYMVDVLDGDLRNIINNIQVINSTHKKINITTVKKVINKPSKFYINKILEYVNLKNTEKAIEIMRKLLINGNDAFEILKLLFNIIIESNYENKHNFIKYLGEIEYHITDGSDPEIQLCYLLCLMTD